MIPSGSGTDKIDSTFVEIDSLLISPITRQTYGEINEKRVDTTREEVYSTGPFSRLT